MVDPYTKYNVRATHAALNLPNNVDAKATSKKILESIVASSMAELVRDQDPWMVN